jgi:hypothetical protein
VLISTAVSTAILAVILFGLHNFGARNDFRVELWPAYQALYAGDFHEFVSATPSYVGAAVWRAPFALVAMACGAGWRVTFLATAAPCFAVLGLFGVWFAGRQGDSRSRRRATALGVAVFTVIDPVVWYAGVQGHPEELVGGALAIAAVIVAARGRHRLAAGLLAAALLNKPGLVELVPVVLVVTRSRSTRPALALCLLGALAYAVYELYFYFDLPISQLTAGITAGGGFFPWHLLWWLGAGAWPVMHEHVLLVPACVLLAGAWWVRHGDDPSRGRARRADRDPVREALWFAAFMILFRNAFDPWNTLYYSLPLVMCLLCLEAGRPPWLTVAASVAVVLAVPVNRILPLSPTGQAALFTAVAVPALAGLAWRVASGGLKRPHSGPFCPVLPSAYGTPTLPAVSQ